MSNSELESDIRVNPDCLDREWVNQPSLFFKYASLLAEAREEFERAKNSFELVRAELDQKVRSDPPRYGIHKLTEAAVSAVVPTLGEYQKAREELLAAKHKVDILEAVVTAMEHRKKALEKLVDLYLAGYFSYPRSSDVSSEGVEDMQKRVLRRGRNRAIEE